VKLSGEDESEQQEDFVNYSWKSFQTVSSLELDDLVEPEDCADTGAPLANLGADEDTTLYSHRKAVGDSAPVAPSRHDSVTVLPDFSNFAVTSPSAKSFTKSSGVTKTRDPPTPFTEADVETSVDTSGSAVTSSKRSEAKSGVVNRQPDFDLKKSPGTIMRNARKHKQRAPPRMPSRDETMSTRSSNQHRRRRGSNAFGSFLRRSSEISRMEAERMDPKQSQEAEGKSVHDQPFDYGKTEHLGDVDSVFDHSYPDMAAKLSLDGDSEAGMDNSSDRRERQRSLLLHQIVKRESTCGSLRGDALYLLNLMGTTSKRDSHRGGRSSQHYSSSNGSSFMSSISTAFSSASASQTFFFHTSQQDRTLAEFDGHELPELNCELDCPQSEGEVDKEELEYDNGDTPSAGPVYNGAHNDKSSQPPRLPGRQSSWDSTRNGGSIAKSPRRGRRSDYMPRIPWRQQQHHHQQQQQQVSMSNIDEVEHEIDTSASINGDANKGLDKSNEVDKSQQDCQRRCQNDEDIANIRQDVSIESRKSQEQHPWSSNSPGNSNHSSSQKRNQELSCPVRRESVNTEASASSPGAV